MGLTLSPPVKILALVGLLAALGIAAGSTMLGRSGGGSAAPARPAVHRAAHAKAPAAHVARPDVQAAKPARPVAKPKPLVAANGLPTALAALLHDHRVVVVSLYDPEIRTDAWALREAQAGAHDAGAGFLGVDVLNARVAGPLTSAAGDGTTLPSPGILVYRRPAELLKQVDGFADRASVAALAADAALAPATAAAAATTTP